MDQRTQDAVNTLAYIFGIDTSAPIETKTFLLKDMDAIPENATEENLYQHVTASLNKALDAEFTGIMKPTNVVRENRQQDIEINVPVGYAEQNLSWSITEKNGTKHQGEQKLSEMPLVLDFQGNPRRRVVDGVEYEKRIFKMPVKTSLGYHSLEMTTPDGKHEKSQIASCPQKCYAPIDIENGEKTWGVPVQMYEQKSEENQGMGDFSDLDEISHTLAKAGAGIVGINPIHAMASEKPEEASPYSPWSRKFYNHSYCDVTAIPDFNESKKATELYDSEEYTQKRRRAQRVANIDYTTVNELKQPIAEACFDSFYKKHLGLNPSARGKQFIDFCNNGGEDLTYYATFTALSMEMAQLDPAPRNWKEWPEEYQNINSFEFKSFAERNKHKIEFYKYMQWEANRQLGNVQSNCMKNGMKIGLYTDIAVGSSPNGYEAWKHKSLFMKGSAGTPPDILNTNGSEWCIMGFKPNELKNKGYEPFREMLEANMRHAGCARLDHVLQLARLFMIPQGKTGKEGAYVYYPVDDLMAIVALESHLNKCMTIGEDLGQVPDGFRDKLADHGILSYRVMLFERGAGLTHPNDYPTYSAAAPSTHDTPPLASQWTARHIHQKDFLGFYDDDQEKKNREFEDIARYREQINWALNERGSWQKVGAEPVKDPRHDTKSVPFKFEQAVADYLGQSNSAIMLMPFSDMFRTNYMGNMPGTVQTHSSFSEKAVKDYEDKGTSKLPFYNWRPKMHVPTHAIKSIPVFKDIANIFNGYRSAGINKEKQSQISEEYQRPGRNETYGKSDPSRIYRIYEALAKKGQIKDVAYDIISAKFSKKHQDKEYEKFKKLKEDAENRSQKLNESKNKSKIVEGLLSPMQFAARVVRKGNR